MNAKEGTKMTIKSTFVGGAKSGSVGANDLTASSPGSEGSSCLQMWKTNLRFVSP